MKLKNCRWIIDEWRAKNDEFSARLTPFDNPAYRAEDIKQDVRAGNAQVSNLFDGKRHVGFFVYQIDKMEFVILALFIEPEIRKALEIAMPYIDTLAKSLGCKSTRFNTARPGLVDTTKKYGFEFSEIVMRKHYEK